ncbi:MAG: penicillin-binding protein 2 [Pseudomonadota bacterium]
MKNSYRKPLRDSAREGSIFRTRAQVSFLLVCLTFAVLGLRYGYLQVIKHEEFTTRAENNRVKYRALAPNRGLILDRNGIILADNRPAYRLELIPEQVKNLDETLDRLRELIDLSDRELERFHKLRKARRSFQAVPLRLRMDETAVARFAVDRHRFPGVDIVPYQTRHYPRGPDFVHVVGYVGQLDAEDLSNVDASRYAATSYIGKTGLELAYESVLHGEVGREKVETNVQGRILRSLDAVPPDAGYNLHLTLDARLQELAVKSLGDFTGAIVAVEPGTGEVLAMVSRPGFDPNAFVGGLTVAQYQALLDSSTRPLFDRALRGGYEPGSTIKPYIALAGLENGYLDLSTQMFSNGYFQLPGQSRRYRDWKPGGHGLVDVVSAIEESVNVFFYDLASKMGIDTIHEYVSQFGFGAATGIDLRGEAIGILPSSAWKRANVGEPWYRGETVIAGIGQGFTVTTPLQLAHAAAVLAARGESRKPHLVLRAGASAPEQVTRPATRVTVGKREHWEAVIEGMVRVVHGANGTAQVISADNPPYTIAGKSGTAQVYGLAEGEEYVEDEVPFHLRDHALFIAFAPAEAPTIALVVVVEHGGGGSTVAGPIARQIIDAHLLGFENNPVALTPAGVAP